MKDKSGKVVGNRGGMDYIAIFLFTFHILFLRIIRFKSS